MLLNQKSKLILIHKQLVKEGHLFIAQVLFQHLAGLSLNPKVADFLLSLFES
ncbi:MAG: hypothetical protein M1480_13985 [Bacteroidetes bacterium]|nr:hypothetical protein [Bacteroidota bacterium]